MGYRFNLDTANIVANLTFGKVMSCYREICSSPENYERFMLFLEGFEYNMYSNEKEGYLKRIRRIREVLFNHMECKPFLDFKLNCEEEFVFHKEALDALRELSIMFERCTIKSLLLPPVRNNRYNYDFMTSERTLRTLYKRHPGDTCLILQPQECPYKATVFNAFPNFDVALRQAEMWPAVLFWEDSDNYAFIPIKHEEELLYLYKIIEYDRYPINELKRIAKDKTKGSHYIFQLSDLHFGAKDIGTAERRLKSLIKKQLSTLEIGDTVGFIVTGDAVDSPRKSAEEVYLDFSQYIEEQCGKKPFRIIGNHDINRHGLALFHGRQRISNYLSEYPRIEKLEESKVILLLFNSNTGGNLAEGKIGIQQMAEMGNILDKEVPDPNNYLLIAVLHHHLLPISKPAFYERKWFEKIIPENYAEYSLKLLDADLFLEWLHKRNVRIVLHGHKHIPYISTTNDITVIGCGSSTGQIHHKEKDKTYISYNILKRSENSVTCCQFAEEIYGAGDENIRTEVIEL